LKAIVGVQGGLECTQAWDTMIPVTLIQEIVSRHGSDERFADGSEGVLSRGYDELVVALLGGAGYHCVCGADGEDCEFEDVHCCFGYCLS